MPSPINTALLKLSRRADAVVDQEMLVDTFVDVGPLLTLMSSEDHQVLFGRRGTGKTHALTYLGVKAEEVGDVAALIDLRTIGSTGGLYGDSNIPLTERGTRLLADVLAQLHEALLNFAYDHSEDRDMTKAWDLLDELADAITEVRVVGQTETETIDELKSEDRSAASAGAAVDKAGPSIKIAGEAATTRTGRRQLTTRASGTAQHRVHFGRVSKVLQELVSALGVRRVWILLDEWSAVPIELQPLLADLLRRAVFPVRGVVVKIAAIEQRSTFKVSLAGPDYLGIELGADAAADLDLDDYMVFGNDPEQAKLFFRELLYRHVRAQMVEENLTPPESADAFQAAAFTQRNAIDEFVRAAEGVPRDAINIVRIAAQRAGDDPISVEHVRTAARRWYLTDKERAVAANEDAAGLLHWIVDIVIGARRARAFLLHQRERQNALVTELYDARVLHVIKRSVSSRDQPGERYDVYAIDFGCYVELNTTTKAPQGLFEAELDDYAGFVDVPVDDYRSIRRAILDLMEFDNAERQLVIRPLAGQLELEPDPTIHESKPEADSDPER